MITIDPPIIHWRERLRSKSPVLHPRDLAIDSQPASSAVAVLWGARLIEPIASSRLYRNHVAKRAPTSMDFARIVSIEAPTALVSGRSALAISGVIRSSPAGHVEVSLLAGIDEHQVPSHAGVVLRPHAPRWRQIIDFNGGVTVAPVAGGSVPCMTPGAALAELLMLSPELAPSPDEIDFKALLDIDDHRFRRLAGLPYCGSTKDVYAQSLARQVSRVSRMVGDRKPSPGAYS